MERIRIMGGVAGSLWVALREHKDTIRITVGVSDADLSPAAARELARQLSAMARRTALAEHKSGEGAR